MMFNLIKTIFKIRAIILISIIATSGLALAQTKSNDRTKIHFVISHRPALLTSLPSYLAEFAPPKGLGLFKKYGLDVDFTEGSGGGSTLRLLSTGDVHIAEGGAPAAYNAARLDKNIELVGGWSNSANVMVWITKKSNNISGVKDLEGATLGYTGSGSASQFLSNNSMKLAGIEDYKIVSLNGMGDNWTAVKANVITAGWAMEPFLSDKILNDDAEVVLWPGDYIEHFYLEGIAVNKKFAGQNKQAVSDVFRSLYEAVQFIEENPDEAAAMAQAFYPNSTEEILLNGINEYIKQGVWDMTVDLEAYESNMRGMVLEGQAEEEFDIIRLLNQEYWPEELRRTK